uniref:Uncharacterized protein n=1 Tax=Candidatus Kentrum sp. LPFa TaxID=2126335 RepID=A0A450WQJ7_9GAMM|nr:MAG: hypothetical protein BECKLPF1236A_GA0070988_102211 [Candidatus Kentron sp. LPFa]VFK33993.1 MAG: hypothetical protein BECKLPF1236C_GA0070990_102363 [Candidatus Kentron sp. LPFa]
MAFPSANEVTDEAMVAVEGIEWFTINEGAGNKLELIRVLAATPAAIEIPCELLRIDRPIFLISRLALQMSRPLAGPCQILSALLTQHYNSSIIG